jgi:hypothetical protein
MNEPTSVRRSRFSFHGRHTQALSSMDSSASIPATTPPPRLSRMVSLLPVPHRRLTLPLRFSAKVTRGTPGEMCRAMKATTYSTRLIPSTIPRVCFQTGRYLYLTPRLYTHSTLPRRHGMTPPLLFTPASLKNEIPLTPQKPSSSITPPTSRSFSPPSSHHHCTSSPSPMQYSSIIALSSPTSTPHLPLRQLTLPASTLPSPKHLPPQTCSFFTLIHHFLNLFLITAHYLTYRLLLDLLIPFPPYSRPVPSLKLQGTGILKAGHGPGRRTGRPHSSNALPSSPFTTLHPSPPRRACSRSGTKTTRLGTQTPHTYPSPNRLLPNTYTPSFKAS